MEETINKISQGVEVFGLDAAILTDLVGTKPAIIRNNLTSYMNTLGQIQQRKHTFPLPTDQTTEMQTMNAIRWEVREYQKFLPEFQQLVERFLDNKEKIAKKAAEKRQADEKAPSEEETRKSLDDAEKKLQEAAKEQPNVQKTFGTIGSFIQRAAPYVKTLFEAASLALRFL